MRRTELQHNTPEQVDHYLKQALVLIEENDVPEDLRVAAFAAVFNLVASKQVVLEQASMGVDLGALTARH